MRLHIYSDLHLEFAPINLPVDVTSGKLADLVLLAGDIHVRRRSVSWAAATFHQPTVLVGGNHEAYGDSLFAAISENRKQAREATRLRENPVFFLERESCEIMSSDGTPVRVVGATLWTDFCLFGADRAFVEAARAHDEMNDYRYIKIQDSTSFEKRCLTPDDTVKFHAASRQFILETLQQKFDGITIVMTHHAPSSLSFDPLQPKSCAAAYASSLDELIEAYQPDLWAHGHVHVSSDYRIGKTRIVCNPRGYHPHYLNPAFDPALIIDLD